ncbi:MAG: flagellar basal body-associated FliL family protein [Kofleriaceae bacterium]|nr:flagellar basal body-associated FliL family protein [Kofleriaceae bacterium]
MSDEPVKSADAAPAGAKTSKAVLALLVLNLGASGFATFKLVTAKPAAAAPAHEEKEEGATKTEVTGPVIALQPFVVNLDEPGQSRYLKVTMQFELVAPEVEALIEKNKQVIRDAILSHLSGLKLADTLGAAAKDKLRADVMKKVEEIVGERKVRRMFFQEFVVQ